MLILTKGVIMTAMIKKERGFKLSVHFFLSAFLLFFTLGCGGNSSSSENVSMPEPNIIYSWTVGDWGVCSGPCGTDNATQSRTVTCIASTGESVADSMCTTPKPATTQACTASECPVNNAPVIHTDFQDLALQQNSGTTNYELNVSDADGDKLTLSVVSSDTSVITVEPNWINPLKLADYKDQTLDFNLTTVADAFGVVTITITVDDGEANTTKSFDVNVTQLIMEPVKKTGQTKSYSAAGGEVTDGSLKDDGFYQKGVDHNYTCLLYTSPSPRDRTRSRMPSSA